MGLQPFHLHTIGWLLSQGLMIAFSLGLIQKKQVKLFKLGNTEKFFPKIRPELKEQQFSPIHCSKFFCHVNT